MNRWIDKVFKYPELLSMGHCQDAGNRNLGLGWLYYSQIRLLKPKNVVCIGSWRGFVPLILAKGLLDNANNGKLHFIDPSLVDDFWVNKSKTLKWFENFGLNNVQHHLATTQDFIEMPAYKRIKKVQLLFIDGYHSAKQAKFDYEAFEDVLTPDSSVFFHDSIRDFTSGIYGREKIYNHSVYSYIVRLKKRADLQCMDFDFGSGVTLVRKAPKISCKN